MYYYTVWVRSLSYRGKELLTYAYELKLPPGTIVIVPLQREQVAGFIMQAVPRPKFSTKTLEPVMGLSPLPVELLHLATWLRDYYATSVGAVGSVILPSKLPSKITTQAVNNVVSKTTKPVPYPLNTKQASVVAQITKSDTYLLHGRTGSGKTRIYIELASRALKNKQSVMVLTPEISLTAQLSGVFRQVFGEHVVVLHSQLTPSQRQTAWLHILSSTTPLIIIGPRSVLFSPLRNIGLIVIDEAHEPAYKQEQTPYYHARPVASKLADLHNATLLLGSATPSLIDYYLAEKRHKPILRLQSVAGPKLHTDTKVEVIDLKDRSQFSRSPHLSNSLLKVVDIALQNRQQSLIYLNRRGTARVVLCENCGWQALCPHCDLPLVYHADSQLFRCHTCGYHQPLITSCPVCGQPDIVFKSFGTKALFEEVHKLFPNARIKRFDTDNSKAERFEQQYESITSGEVDILIGTQLLAKGLDLPNLAVLGVVLADSSLSIPDFSARERTFQLLSQALGRVGRGHTAGQAVIQTYHPESPLLKVALTDDWDTFYNAELGERRKFHFPPYYQLLKLTCRRATYRSAEAAANKLKSAVLNTITGIEIDGPVPAFHERSQGKYQCQLVMRSQHRQQLLQVMDLLPASGWTYDIDPTNLL